MIEKIDVYKLKDALMRYDHHFDKIGLFCSFGMFLTFRLSPENVDSEFASISRNGNFHMIFSKTNIIDTLKTLYEHEDEPDSEEKLYDDLANIVYLDLVDDLEDEEQNLEAIRTALGKEEE